MASLSKRFADINYRVERACELSKNGIKNLTNRYVGYSVISMELAITCNKLQTVVFVE